MKLARVVIENFRQIDSLDLDFTDSFGRVRDRTLLVGPNGCGKTTILDAVAAAIGPTSELPATRPHFRVSPATVVRRGALRARVECHLRFSSDEISATREAFALHEEAYPVPDAQNVTLTWTYPDPRGRSRYGFTRCDPAPAWTLLKGRVYTARLLRVGRAGWDAFRRVGGVFTVDQWRTSLGKTIRRDIWHIIEGRDADAEARRTSDPRTILLEMAVKAQFPSRGERGDDFARVREEFGRLCHPRTLVGADRDEQDRWDLRFSDGVHEYGYDGVSSGEAMVLLLLTRLVSEHVHRSILLVDEVELHQHPVWQRRLLHLLSHMGEDNQLIATTHSPYLREGVSRAEVIDIGDLDESPRVANA